MQAPVFSRNLMAYRNRWLVYPGSRISPVTTFYGRRGGSDDPGLGHSNRPANHLKCLTVNGAATVGMGLEHARSDSAFQSEKTGSTPVGSAMNPLMNLESLIGDQ